MIFTATLKFLPEDAPAYNAFDYMVFSTFENGRVRLERKLRAEAPGGLGKAEEEIIGEFTCEQFQEHAAVDMIRRADVIRCADTQTPEQLAG